MISPRIPPANPIRQTQDLPIRVCDEMTEEEGGTMTASTRRIAKGVFAYSSTPAAALALAISPGVGVGEQRCRRPWRGLRR